MVLERVMDRRSATELRAIENRVVRIEATAAWRRVHRLGNRIHLAVVAERPDVIEQSAGELVTLAGRALRQMGEGPEAA